MHDAACSPSRPEVPAERPGRGLPGEVGTAISTRPRPLAAAADNRTGRNGQRASRLGSARASRAPVSLIVTLSRTASADQTPPPPGQAAPARRSRLATVKLLPRASRLLQRPDPVESSLATVRPEGMKNHMLPLLRVRLAFTLGL